MLPPKKNNQPLFNITDVTTRYSLELLRFAYFRPVIETFNSDIVNCQ